MSDRLRILTLGLAFIIAAPALASETPESSTAPAYGFAGNFLIARAAEVRGDWQKAGLAFSNVSARDPYSPEFIHRQSVLLLNQGRFDEALALAGRMQGGGAGTHLANLLVFAGAARANDREAARLAYKDISDDGLGQYLKPFFAAWLADSYKDAAEALRPISDMPSLEGMVKLHTALLAARYNDITEARQSFARIIAASPTYRTVALAASFYAGHEMTDRRNALLEAGLAAGVEPSLIANLRKNADSADGVGTLSEGVAETLFGLASLLQMEGANDVALPYLRIAAALRPNFSIANLMIGDLLLRLGRYEEARSAYAGEETARDIGAMATLRLSALETSIDGPLQARTRLEGLVSSSPEWVEAWAQLGDTAFIAGDLTAAASHLSKAIELSSSNAKDLKARLLFSRAVVYHRMQDNTRAEADLEASLELVPDNAERLNYLGYMLADRGVRLELAEQLISKAIALEPNSANIIDSLGWVKLRAGNAEEAVRLLELAAEMTPYNPVINDHLGDAYWAAGREREARFQWERSIAYRADAGSSMTSVEDLRLKIERGIAHRQTAER